MNIHTDENAFFPTKFAVFLLIAVEVFKLQIKSYCSDLFDYSINCLNSFKVTWRLRARA